MLSKPLLVNGQPFSPIAGATIYFDLHLTIEIKVDNVATQVPIAYEDAIVSVIAYKSARQTTAFRTAQTSAGENGRVAVRIAAEDSLALGSDFGDQAVTLDARAVLKYDLANTKYKAGDAVMYRWTFTLQPPSPAA